MQSTWTDADVIHVGIKEFSSYYLANHYRQPVSGASHWRENKSLISAYEKAHPKQPLQ